MPLNIRKAEPRKTGRRVAFMADPGWGKTAFAASAPNPLFIQCERDDDILSHVDAFPFCKTTDDVLQCFRDLIKEGVGDYQTIVVDSASQYMEIGHDELCKEMNWGAINHLGFGKGEGAAAMRFAVPLMKAAECLQEKFPEVNVIMLCHTTVANIKNPDGSDYGRRTLSPDKWSAQPFTARCTEVFYGTTDVVYTGGKEGKGATAISAGERIIKTRGVPALDAKNRLHLPAEISVPEYACQADNNLWDHIMSHANQGAN